MRWPRFPRTRRSCWTSLRLWPLRFKTRRASISVIRIRLLRRAPGRPAASGRQPTLHRHKGVSKRILYNLGQVFVLKAELARREFVLTLERRSKQTGIIGVQHDRNTGVVKLLDRMIAKRRHCARCDIA